jgi:8-oxo-dGTP diphosphatase
MNKYANIDWTTWQPDERAVIVYIADRKLRKLLLIIKKKGLGQGKVNAPGGRLEPGETFLEAAIRECREEVSMIPVRPEKRMELHFQFTSGYALYGEAFFADSWEGEARPSDEADPFWCDLDDIPWDKMWEDDRNWLPQALDGKKQRGFYVFDDDTMLSEILEEVDSFDE